MAIPVSITPMRTAAIANESLALGLILPAPYGEDFYFTRRAPRISGWTYISEEFQDNLRVSRPDITCFDSFADRTVMH